MVNIVTQRHEWSINHIPATNLQATITRAANALGRHIITSITATLSGASAAGAVKSIFLRDGVSGAGPIIWSATVLNLAGDSKAISLTNLNIQGSKNTAMTLEFNAAGGTGTFESVALTGYTETDVVQKPE